MKVTPTNRAFGKYKPGDVFDLPDKTAKVFIKVGKLKEADVVAPPQTYQTRMLTASPPVAADPAPNPAPYGYKADGTPRLRPAYNVRKVED